MTIIEVQASLRKPGLRPARSGAIPGTVRRLARHFHCPSFWKLYESRINAQLETQARVVHGPADHAAQTLDRGTRRGFP
jgi:hypothetical protein